MIEQIVKNSIRELARRCDFASSLDGQGFNKLDANFGHSLAGQQNWSSKQLSKACELVIKYHGQLPDVDIEKVKLLYKSLGNKIEKEMESKEKSISVNLMTDKNGNNKIAVQMPKVYDYINKIKTLEGRRWNPTYLRWELPMQNLNRLKQIFPNASYSDGIENYESILQEKDELVLKEFKKISANLDLSKPLPNKMIPFKHQKEGILRLLRTRRLILADDMGLGKTLQSLVAAKILSEYYNWIIIIVCPVSLKDNWERTALALKISKLKFSVHSWAKIPVSPPKDFIFIADEAHYAQAGTKTVRGKAFLKLASNDGCKACYLVTGTPIKNGRPINIFPLLEAVRHELSQDSRYFQLRYCNAHLRQIGRKVKFWDTSGAGYLQELHDKIKNVMIRRTKKECLDLPEKLRVLREADFSPDAISNYNETLYNLRKKYKDRVESGEIKEDAEAMVMLQHLAHAGAIGKVDSTLELAMEVVEEGNQVVIFSTFLEPLNTLVNKFSKEKVTTELLIGDTKDRQGAVDNFLAKKSQVFLLSMAGGVGIDLYTANTIILINRPWTPGDTIQIEDRLHRIGQQNAVTSIWLQYGEVDKHVDDVLYNKSLNIDSVLADKSKDSIISFAKKFLKGN